MSIRSITITLTAIAILGFAGFASAENKPAPAKGRPTASDVQKQMNKNLAIQRLKSRRNTLVGPVGFGTCSSAKTAEDKYEACEDRCATWASSQSLTAGDLAACGDEMSAAACADKILDEKAGQCIRKTGTPGCRDEQRALIKARQACKECNAEIAKVAALNQKKSAKEADIAKLQSQLNAAKADVAKLDEQLEETGKPCAPKNGVKKAND